MAFPRLDPFHRWNIEYAQKGPDRANFFLSRVQRCFTLHEKKVLDLGCGRGFLSIAVSKTAHEVIAIDIADQSLRILKKRLHHSKTFNISLVKADAINLPIKSGVLDATLSYDLYEHVRNQSTLLCENFRVVKRNGCVAFSTGNRLFPKDRHTGLWFIDYLPKRIADFYVRLRKKRGSYDIYQPTYWSLKRKLRKFSSIYFLDGESALEMIREVYPNLSRRWAKFLRSLHFAARAGIFKFFTPKFFVIAFKVDRHESQTEFRDQSGFMGK